MRTAITLGAALLVSGCSMGTNSSTSAPSIAHGDTSAQTAAAVEDPNACHDYRGVRVERTPLRFDEFPDMIVAPRITCDAITEVGASVDVQLFVDIDCEGAVTDVRLAIPDQPTICDDTGLLSMARTRFSPPRDSEGRRVAITVLQVLTFALEPPPEDDP